MTSPDHTPAEGSGDRQRASAGEGHGCRPAVDRDREPAAVPEDVVEDHSLQLGGQAGGERHRVGAEPHPGIPVQELLQEASDPGHEGERSARARLRELVEHVADEGLIAALGVDEARAAGRTQRRAVNRVHGIAHRRAHGVGAGNVVVQVVLGHVVGHRVLPRVLQQGDVRLLDELPLVAEELGVDALPGAQRDHQSGGDLRPGGGVAVAQYMRRLDRVGQRGLGAHVGEDGVVDVGVLLVGVGDVVDVVPAVASLHRPRGPERRGLRQHRPPLGRQPVAVPRGQVVLPLRERDVGGDVLLVEPLAVDRRGRGDLLGAVERALPREARALEAGRGGVLLGCPKTIEAVGLHRLGQRRMLGQQRGEHPCLGVPEDVAVVAVGGQARGGDAPIDAVARARPQVELAGVDIGGERAVAEHVNPP